MCEQARGCLPGFLFSRGPRAPASLPAKAELSWRTPGSSSMWLMRRKRLRSAAQTLRRTSMAVVAFTTPNNLIPQAGKVCRKRWLLQSSIARRSKSTPASVWEFCTASAAKILKIRGIG